MKCARCNKPLLSATVQIGTLALGRVCAVKLGFGRAKRRAVKPAVTLEDPAQLRLELAA